jgi:hypothetical protein
LRGGAFVEGDEERPGLAEFGFEDSEVAPDGLEAGVINFRGLIVHRYEVIIVLSDFLILGLVAGLEAELLKQVLQANGTGDIL